METTNAHVFHFEEGTHKYYLGDELLPGVTTILGTLAKPALIQWASNENTKCLEENGVKMENGHLVISPELLEQARTAHAKKRDKAADQGTNVHAQIETYINKCIAENEGLALPVLIIEGQLGKFITWATTNKVVFHESERKLYSVDHRFAGTVDFTATINGKRVVGDIKTTSGIYDLSPFLQCAAYRIMLEEMGEEGYVGSIIIRLGKDGSFEEYYRADELGTDMKTFLSLLEVYKALATFKNSNKK
jgi:hypothetical protein